MNKSGRLILKQKHQAFTIVELLVVIVVIGILAVITIVSYSGIQTKAIAVSLENDLDSNGKLLKMYNVEYGYYPNSINTTTYCPDAPTADTRYCLKSMTGAALTYTGSGQSFILTDTHTASGFSYQITENGATTAIIDQSNNIELQYISSGYSHSCAIASDNNAYCWGDNGSGQLGNNSTTDSWVPIAVDRSGVLSGLTIKHD